MGKSQYVSLQDAALLADKSPQTIRRLVKSHKIRYRKYRTPQGFTYLVEKTSLLDHFGDEANQIEETEDMELVEEFDPDMEDMDDDEPMVQEVRAPIMGREAPPSQQPAFRINQYREQASIRTEAGMDMGARSASAGMDMGATPPPSSRNGHEHVEFQGVMTQLIQQHRDDKKRLFELLEIFQKRILTLEDQLKQLEGPKKRSWWRFGK